MDVTVSAFRIDFVTIEYIPYNSSIKVKMKYILPIINKEL